MAKFPIRNPGVPKEIKILNGLIWIDRDRLGNFQLMYKQMKPIARNPLAQKVLPGLRQTLDSLLLITRFEVTDEGVLLFEGKMGSSEDGKNFVHKLLTDGLEMTNFS